MKTSCRRLEGRSRARCAPPVPDSLELPPAAVPARTAGSHRRVSALLKPSQMPHQWCPVPSGCRLCCGGSGSPPRAGSPARPCSATRSVAARPQRLGRRPARQWRKADAGRAPRLPERRSWPGDTRGSVQLLQARSSGREARWKSRGGAARQGQGESKRRQPFCSPSLAKGAPGYSFFFCWLAGLGFGVDLF